MKALFVTTANALGVEGKPKGGVQICTSEYRAVLGAAGFEISTITFTPDRRLRTRIRRRLQPRPYQGLIPPQVASEIVDGVKRTNAQVVFLNLVDLAPLAKELRQLLGKSVKIILLSHGLGCADVLHEIRHKCFQEDNIQAKRRDLVWLAGHLVAESDQRKYIDHVFCLSEFDVGLERWVGTRSVSWLPRIVTPNPLPWTPVKGRVGFVGTLDHAPNAEGVELLLEMLVEQGRNDLRVRIVGGPVEGGQALAKRYGIVEYLGPLADGGLEKEAGTWSSAVHPLFCYSRGCSTKLAVMMGWQIPIISTPQGRRGYIWKEGSMPMATSPREFADLVVRVQNPDFGELVRAEVTTAAKSAPVLQDVAKQVCDDLTDVVQGHL